MLRLGLSRLGRLSEVGTVVRSYFFRAPLQTNILTTRGAGTPTFTRASAATVVDFEGVVRLCKSGEARMQGWRRVENLLQGQSEGNPTFSVSSGLSQSGTSIALTAAATSYAYVGTSVLLPVGSVAVVRCLASSSVNQTVLFRVANSLSGPNNAVANIALTSTPQVVTLTLTIATASGAVQFGIDNRAAAGATNTGAIGAITFTNIQIENVTGQSIQTPAEYVPRGTGGPNFGPEQAVPTTSTTGWSAAGTSAAMASDGTSITVTNGATSEASAVVTGVTVQAGKTYLVSCNLVALTGTTSGYVVLGTGNLQLNGAAGVKTGLVSVTSSGTLRIAVGTAAAGNAITFKNLSVVECLFSGANVDGVKYFDTRLDGTAIPKTATSGYINEPQRTNLLLSACDLTGAAWVNGSTTVSTGSVHPVFTSQMIASTGATWNRKSQTVSLTTTTYAVSAYYKIGSSGKAYVALYLDPTHFIDAEFSSVGTRLSLGSLGITAVSAWKSTLVPGSTNLFVADCVVTITSAGSYSIGLGPSSATVGQTVEFLGAQVEAGSSISSVIPTTTAAAVRDADSLALPVAANASQGTLVVTLSAPGADAAGRYPGVALHGSQANTQNLIGIYCAPNMNSLNLFVRSNGVNSTDTVIFSSPTANAKYKIAIAWNAEGRFAVSVNGGAVTVITGVTLPLLLAFFRTIVDNEWFGTVGNLQVYAQPLSDATLRALTA